jgi:hypothetical protein
LSPWLNYNGIFQLTECLICVPIWLLLYFKLNKHSSMLNVVSGSLPTWVNWLMAIGIIFYIQGRTIQGIAVIFKNVVLAAHESANATTDPDLGDIFRNLNNMWQYLLGHYMYFFGIWSMMICHGYANRDDQGSQLNNTLEIIMFIFSLIFFGVAFTGQIVFFPYGIYTGIAFIGLFLILFLFELIKSRSLFPIGKKLVIQFYLYSLLLIALPLLIIWVVIFGFQPERHTNSIIQLFASQ